MKRMNQLFTSTLLFLAGFSLASCQKTPINEQLPEYCNDYITFTDLVSEDMRSLLGGVNRFNFSTITSQVELEFEINDPSQTIDLNGIQCFQNLTSLTLVGQSFRDISPLAALVNLQQIKLIDTNIVSIDALKNLSKVNELTISNAQLLQNVKGVEQMTKLRALDLSGNGIVTIEELNNLVNLEDLVLSHNKIRYIPPISKLTKLKYLDLSFNEIEEFSGDLTGLVNLEILVASHNHITDLSPLDDLEKIITLDLSSNRLGLIGEGVSPDFSSLNHSYQLKNLYLNDNQLTSISGLSVINSPIELLHLQSNQIEDISPIRHLSSLKDLGLKNNLISSLPSMEGWDSLTELDLSDNQLTDFTNLLDVTSLETLNLSNNHITLIPQLKDHWAHLTQLNLHGNRLQDTSGVDGHTTLETLVLTNNGLSTISGIQHLPALESFIIDKEIDPNSPFYVDEEETAPNRIEKIQDSFNDVPSLVLQVGGQLTLPFYGFGDTLTIENSFNDIPLLEEITLVNLHITLIDEESFHSTSLRLLNLDNNQLDDISFIKHMPALEVFSANSNKAMDLSVLSQLSSLKMVSLQSLSSSVSLEGAFIDLPLLESVNLSGSSINSISNSFVNLPKISSLQIDGSQVTSIQHSFIDIFTRNSMKESLVFSNPDLSLIEGSFYSQATAGTYGSISFLPQGSADTALIISDSFNNIHATQIMIISNEITSISSSFIQSYFTLVELKETSLGGSTTIEDSFNLLNLGNSGQLTLTDVTLESINHSFNSMMGKTLSMTLETMNTPSETSFIYDSFGELSLSTEVILQNVAFAQIDSSFNDITSAKFSWTNILLTHINKITTVDNSFNDLKVTSNVTLLNNQWNEIEGSLNQVQANTIVLNYSDVQAFTNGFNQTVVNTLDLSNNYLSTLPSLEFIGQVNTLDLSFNSLNTVSFMEAISPTLLATVDASFQRDRNGVATLTVIDGINEIPSLRNLNLDGNAITSIDGLKSIGLTSFSLPLNVNHQTAILSISSDSFAGARLTTLDLADHSVSDLSFLMGLQSVSLLHLPIFEDERDILDSLPYQSSIQLLELALEYELDSFSFLSGYQNLTNLNLVGPNQTTIEGLSNLPKLASVYISNPGAITSIQNSFNQIPSMELRSEFFMALDHLEVINHSFDVMFAGNFVSLPSNLVISDSFKTITVLELITTEGTSSISFDTISFENLTTLNVTNWNIDSFSWINQYDQLNTLNIDNLLVNMTDLNNAQLSNLQIDSIHLDVSQITMTIDPQAVVTLTSDNALNLSIETNTKALTADLRNAQVNLVADSSTFEVSGSMSNLTLESNQVTALSLKSLVVNQTLSVDISTLTSLTSTVLNKLIATTMNVTTEQNELRVDYNAGTVSITGDSLTSVHLNGTATEIAVSGPSINRVDRVLQTTIGTHLTVTTLVTNLTVNIPSVDITIEGDNLTSLDLTNTGTKKTIVNTLVSDLTVKANANQVEINAPNATTIEAQSTFGDLLVNSPSLNELVLNQVGVSRNLAVTTNAWSLAASTLVNSSVSLIHTLVPSQNITLSGSTLDAATWNLSTGVDRLSMQITTVDVGDLSYVESLALSLEASNLLGSTINLGFDSQTLVSTATSLQATQLTFVQGTNNHQFTGLNSSQWSMELGDYFTLSAQSMLASALTFSFDSSVTYPSATEDLTYQLSANSLNATGVNISLQPALNAEIFATTLASTTFDLSTNLNKVSVNTGSTSPTSFSGSFAQASEISIQTPTTKNLNLVTPVVEKVSIYSPQAIVNQSLSGESLITFEAQATTLNLTAPNLSRFEILGSSSLTGLRLMGATILTEVELNDAAIGTLTLDNATATQLTLHGLSTSKINITSMAGTSLSIIGNNIQATVTSTATQLAFHGDLSSLTLTGNSLTNLQVSDTTQLTSLSVTANALASLTVTPPISSVDVTTNVSVFSLIAPQVTTLSLTGNAITTLTVDAGSHNFGFNSSITSAMTMSLKANQVTLSVATTQLTITNDSNLNTLSLTSANLSSLLTGSASLSTLNITGVNANLSIQSDNAQTINITKQKGNGVTLTVDPKASVSIQHEGTSTLSVNTTTESLTLNSTRAISVTGNSIKKLTATTSSNVTLNSSMNTVEIGGSMSNFTLQDSSLSTLSFSPSTQIRTMTIQNGSLTGINLTGLGTTGLTLTTDSTSFNLVGSTLTTVNFTGLSMASITFQVASSATMTLNSDSTAFEASGTLNALTINDPNLTDLTLSQASLTTLSVATSPLANFNVLNSTLGSVQLNSTSSTLNASAPSLTTLGLVLGTSVSKELNLQLNANAQVTIQTGGESLSLQGQYKQVNLTSTSLTTFTNGVINSSASLTLSTASFTATNSGTLSLTTSATNFTLTTNSPTITLSGSSTYSVTTSIETVSITTAVPLSINSTQSTLNVTTNAPTVNLLKDMTAKVITSNDAITVNVEGTSFTLNHPGTNLINLTTDASSITYEGTAAWKVTTSLASITLNSSVGVSVQSSANPMTVTSNATQITLNGSASYTVLTSQETLSLSAGVPVSINSTQTALNLTTTAPSITVLKDMNVKVITSSDAIIVNLEGTAFTLNHTGANLVTLTTDASTVTYEGTSPWKVISSLGSLTLNSDVDLTVQSSSASLMLTSTAPKITNSGTSLITLTTSRSAVEMVYAGSVMLVSTGSALVLTTNATLLTLLSGTNISVKTANATIEVVSTLTSLAIESTRATGLTLTTTIPTVNYTGLSTLTLSTTRSAMTVNSNRPVTINKTGSFELTTNAATLTFSSGSTLILHTSLASINVVTSATTLSTDSTAKLFVTPSANTVSIQWTTFQEGSLDLSRSGSTALSVTTNAKTITSTTSAPLTFTMTQTSVTLTAPSSSVTLNSTTLNAISGKVSLLNLSSVTPSSITLGIEATQVTYNGTKLETLTLSTSKIGTLDVTSSVLDSLVDEGTNQLGVLKLTNTPINSLNTIPLVWFNSLTGVYLNTLNDLSSIASVDGWTGTLYSPYSLTDLSNYYYNQNLSEVTLQESSSHALYDTYYQAEISRILAIFRANTVFNYLSDATLKNQIETQTYASSTTYFEGYLTSLGKTEAQLISDIGQTAVNNLKTSITTTLNSNIAINESGIQTSINQALAQQATTLTTQDMQTKKLTMVKQ